MASNRLQRQIGRLLDEADQAITKEDWTIVSSRARSVLAIDPENTEGLAYLATAERAMGAGPSPATSEPTTSTASSAPTATPHQPTSFANGRYQVQRFLGEGGKKKVYLAHDTTLDREVAFALIKTEGLDDTSRTRIQREAQAMGRLGSHPHIVTVFDLGQEPSTSSGQGQPYMVTELMSGGDVEGMIEDAIDHRLSLEQAINVAKETCRGLQFAHSRGVVHRDLKPGNVWLTGDGTAKIGDFGLAISLDRSRLTQEGMMVGTVSYMPPEQAMGGEVTPKSDLYSLGAMLYEMVTGRPPFLGDDAVAIIGQHINTPPVAPTWHNGQCPRPLEALIMRLLAKNPSERPESATDVLSALEGIDLADVGAIRESPLQDDTHALDSLAGGVFVGRRREMGELKAALEDALSGRGRMVTLVEEPGIGKTRTALELATYAGLRQAQVLWGRCYEGAGAPPYWPWVQAIRSYIRDVDPEQLRSDMGAGAADIGQVVSEVKDRLPGLEAPPQLEPEQARFRLFDSITAFLKSAGRRQPLVLVLDDLHWADHPSLLLLELVARELGNARLMVVGTYRDMELSRQHPLSQTLGELTRERLFQRVLLRGLDQTDVGRFIELASGVAPPTGMVEAVHRQTEGNPLFVTEVVRLLVQEGHLTAHGELVEPSGPSTGSGRTGERDSWSVRIPEGVREVIGRRLDRLSQRCNETLTTASVIGRNFGLRILTALTDDMSEDRLLEVLEEALAARVIEELPRTVGHYQFTHALIQETLAGELSTTRKVRLHARIAETLEELYGEEAEAHAAELAHHFAESASVTGTEKLVNYSLVAGERALSTYAYEEALTHFEQGLRAKEGEPTDEETAGLLFGLARVEAATIERHRVPEVVARLRRAFDYYATIGDVSRAVAVAQFPISPAVGHATGMAELISQGLSLVPPDSLEAGRLQSLYGRVIWQEEGDYAAAQASLDKAVEIARRQGDGSLELQTLADRGEIFGYNNAWDQVPALAVRAAELNKGDDLRQILLCNYWAQLALLALGDPDTAAKYTRESLDIAEGLRHHFYLSRSYFFQSLLHRCLGQWDEARQFSDRGLALTPNESRLIFARVSLEYEVGDFIQGQIYLERLLRAMELTPPGPTLERTWVAVIFPQVGRIIGREDQFQLAEGAASTVLSSTGVTPFIAELAHVGLGLISVSWHDANSAAFYYRALPQSGVGVALGIGERRLLGLLSQTMGELELSHEHFEDSLAFCRKAGYRPELAWTCCDYADMLLDPSTSSGRAVSDNRAKAMSLLDESLAISSELGMRPLMERVLSRREILGA